MSRGLLSRIRKLERSQTKEVTVEDLIIFLRQDENNRPAGIEARWAEYMRDRRLSASSFLEDAVLAAGRLAERCDTEVP